MVIVVCLCLAFGLAVVLLFSIVGFGWKIVQKQKQRRKDENQKGKNKQPVFESFRSNKQGRRRSSNAWYDVPRSVFRFLFTGQVLCLLNIYPDSSPINRKNNAPKIR